MKLRYCLPIVLAISCAQADAPADRPDTTGTAVTTDIADTVANMTAVAPDTALREVLAELVAGKRARAGEHTWFSPATSHVISSVTLDDAGHAVIDFHDLMPVIPNASSSAGSTMLLEELNTAVFSVPEVRTVEYRMAGSCDRFWNWLQYGCQTVSRP